MKKVAKIAARLLVGALMTSLVFSMAGCGKKEEAPKQEEQTAQESADTEIEEIINPEEVKTEVVEEQEDPEAFIAQLLAGEIPRPKKRRMPARKKRRNKSPPTQIWGSWTVL